MKAKSRLPLWILAFLIPYCTEATSQEYKDRSLVTVIPSVVPTTVISSVNPVHNNLVCTTWGNFHFMTFDGDAFRYPGLCNYILASHCKAVYEEFNIQLRRMMVGNVPTIQYVTMKLDGIFIKITQTNVSINNEEIQLPYGLSGIMLEKNVAYISVKTKSGISLKWNMDDALMLQLDSKYMNQTCGLCGDFNGIKMYNEFVSGDILLNPIQFGNFQKLDGPTEQCEDPIPVTPSNCSDYNSICLKFLTGAVFHECNLLTDVGPFIQSCMLDVCNCAEPLIDTCMCSAAAEYSRRCSHAGGQPRNWRTKNFCAKQCPSNMKYQECGIPCMDTCSNQDRSQTCDDHCSDGCYCPPGMVYDDRIKNSCVPISKCPCTHSGTTYLPGELRTSDCHQCVCTGGQWNCMDLPCPSTCSLKGGSHVKTFDGKHYSFHGQCYYLLTSDRDNTFSLLGEIRQCGVTETESCLKSITLVLPGGDKVVIQPSGTVLVNYILTQLPLSAANIVIFSPTSFYILLQTAFGFQVQIQLIPIMQVFIIADVNYKGKLIGLCGTYNDVQSDDFTASNGVIEGTAASFVNTWRVHSICQEITDSFQNPCSVSVENEKYAQHWCSLLTNKTGIFSSCHPVVDPTEFHKNCLYDTCNYENTEDSMCAAISSYGRACAAKGIILTGWRTKVCSKYTTTCPQTMTYSYSVTSCQPSCRSLSDSDVTCDTKFAPVDGCTCVKGTFRDDKGKCVPQSRCPCYYKGSPIPSGEVLSQNGALCTCNNGKLNCIGNEVILPECQPPMVYFDCKNATSRTTGSECQKSCQTLSMECFNTECVPGCMCPRGLVLDGQGGCITEEKCPCIYSGIVYKPGETMDLGCNTCTCSNAKWSCTNMPCQETCAIYGEGHYMSFDKHRFDFSGNCEYVLTQDYCSNNPENGTFRIITENIPCGTTGATCSKSIKFYLGSTELKLSDGSVEVIKKDSTVNILYKIYIMGIYLVIEADNGVVIMWDKKTSMFIKLDPSFKGNVCGLCGNYDGNVNNDFTTRGQSIVIDVQEFGNSWKVSPSCPDAEAAKDPCTANPYRRAWSEKKCGILISPVFLTCHTKVDPSLYYDSCVHDACACDTGGDCACFCTSVAAYAAACNEAGACVAWRTPDICPLFCDYYNPSNDCNWHYKPCGSLCMKTCKNPSGRCNSQLPGLEGCYPECPMDKPFFDEYTMQCVAYDQCGCFDSDGNRYQFQGPVPSSKNCESCTCTKDGIKCKYNIKACYCIYKNETYLHGSVIYNTTDGIGGCITAKCGANGTVDRTLYPCPVYTTLPSTTFETFISSSRHTTRLLPATTSVCVKEVCQWSQWHDVSYPEYKKNGGGDFETFENIRKENYKICESPKDVECKAVNYPSVPIQNVGQKVICNNVTGLICYNKEQSPPICYNYKIRILCCDYMPCEATRTSEMLTTKGLIHSSTKAPSTLKLTTSIKSRATTLSPSTAMVATKSRITSAVPTTSTKKVITTSKVMVTTKSAIPGRSSATMVSAHNIPESTTVQTSTVPSTSSTLLTQISTVETIPTTISTSSTLVAETSTAETSLASITTVSTSTAPTLVTEASSAETFPALTTTVSTTTATLATETETAETLPVSSSSFISASSTTLTTQTSTVKTHPSSESTVTTNYSTAVHLPTTEFPESAYSIVPASPETETASARITAFSHTAPTLTSSKISAALSSKGSVTITKAKASTEESTTFVMKTKRTVETVTVIHPSTVSLTTSTSTQKKWTTVEPTSTVKMSTLTKTSIGTSKIPKPTLSVLPTTSTEAPTKPSTVTKPLTSKKSSATPASTTSNSVPIILTTKTSTAPPTTKTTASYVPTTSLTENTIPFITAMSTLQTTASETSDIPQPVSSSLTVPVETLPTTPFTGTSGIPVSPTLLSTTESSTTANKIVVFTVETTTSEVPATTEAEQSTPVIISTSLSTTSVTSSENPEPTSSAVTETLATEMSTVPLPTQSYLISSPFSVPSTMLITEVTSTGETTATDIETSIQTKQPMPSATATDTATTTSTQSTKITPAISLITVILPTSSQPFITNAPQETNTTSLVSEITPEADMSPTALTTTMISLLEYTSTTQSPVFLKTTNTTLKTASVKTAMTKNTTPKTASATTTTTEKMLTPKKTSVATTMAEKTRAPETISVTAAMTKKTTPKIASATTTTTEKMPTPKETSVATTMAEKTRAPETISVTTAMTKKTTTATTKAASVAFTQHEKPTPFITTTTSTVQTTASEASDTPQPLSFSPTVPVETMPTTLFLENSGIPVSPTLLSTMESSTTANKVVLFTVETTTSEVPITTEAEQSTPVISTTLLTTSVASSEIPERTSSAVTETVATEMSTVPLPTQSYLVSSPSLVPTTMLITEITSTGETAATNTETSIQTKEPMPSATAIDTATTTSTQSTTTTHAISLITLIRPSTPKQPFITNAPQEKNTTSVISETTSEADMSPTALATTMLSLPEYTSTTQSPVFPKTFTTTPSTVPTLSPAELPSVQFVSVSHSTPEIITSLVTTAHSSIITTSSFVSTTAKNEKTPPKVTSVKTAMTEKTTPNTASVKTAMTKRTSTTASIKTAMTKKTTPKTASVTTTTTEKMPTTKKSSVAITMAEKTKTPETISVTTAMTKKTTTATTKAASVSSTLTKPSQVLTTTSVKTNVSSVSPTTEFHSIATSRVTTEIATQSGRPTVISSSATHPVTTTFPALVSSTTSTSSLTSAGMQTIFMPTQTQKTFTTQCFCNVNGTLFSPGALIYSSADSAGWCFYARCSKTCEIERKMEECKSTSTVSTATAKSKTTSKESTTIDKTKSTTIKASTVNRTTPTTSPKGSTKHAGCTDLKPPRKYGETWKIDNCTIATCNGGNNINLDRVMCPAVTPLKCANGRVPVKVYDRDGCCYHYECECVCSGWGDPHYITFDGTYYTFQGNCTYILVQQIIPKHDDFRIYIDNYYCDARDGLSCPRSLIIFYRRSVVVLTQEVVNKVISNQIYFNNQKITPAFQKGGFKISTSGINTIVEIDAIDAYIAYSGMIFSVKLSFSKFGYNTEGQCGTCTNNATEDCRLPGGKIASSCSVMADHWIIFDKNKPYCQPPTPAPPTIHPPTPAPPTIHPPTPATHLTKLTPSPTTKIPCPPFPLCKLIVSSIFAECHKVIPPNPFHEACQFDHCHMFNSSVDCSSLQNYAAMCLQVGICIDWRGHTNGSCLINCPPSKVYEACGPKVQPTCNSRYNDKFIEPDDEGRTEGCFCPNGTILFNSYSDMCVETCYCTGPDGMPKKIGETWQSNCQDCVCDNNTMSVRCDPHSCPVVQPKNCSEEGFVPVLIQDPTDSCCEIYQCVCNITYCSHKTKTCDIGFQLEAKIPDGKCCPVYECVPKGVCVFNNTEYKPGVDVPNDTCKTCVCTSDVNSSTMLNEISCAPLLCTIHCDPGFEYRDVAGECCGECIQTHCVVNLPLGSTHLLKPNETWVSPVDNCTEYECIVMNNKFVTVTNKIVCPPFDPKECVPGSVDLTPDQCCKICTPIPRKCELHSSVKYINQNGCQSKVPVNITSCQGTCGTYSMYSAEANEMEHTCSCCQEVNTHNETIDMVCPEGTTIAYSYIFVDKCDCQNVACDDLYGHNSSNKNKAKEHEQRKRRK